MNRDTVKQLDKALEAKRIGLQQLQKELATSGGRRDGDLEAARDLAQAERLIAQAVVAIARAQAAIAPRTQLNPLIWEPGVSNPVAGL